jgi:hypothetical protein
MLKAGKMRCGSELTVARTEGAPALSLSLSLPLSPLPAFFSIGHGALLRLRAQTRPRRN